ncbi:EAT-20 protein, partial [Aphelenchoides avenae]
PTTASATSIALLSVADNSTGVKLAECRHSVAGKDVKRTLSRWKRVTWTLSEDLLKCNISKDLNATDVISIPIASQADGGSLRREFLVRISAGKGPRCVKDLSAGREQMPVTCPPLFQDGGFSAQNFECGCPELKSTIRRKPISMPKTSGQDADNALSGGDSTSAAASSETLLDVPAQNGNVPFPIFQLTSSMEHGGKRGADGAAAALQADASPSSQPSAVTGTGRPTETTTPEPVDVKKESAASTNACAQFECHHNGTCVLGTNSQPTCLCSEGFSGAHCEVDLCSQIVCQNGGSCLIRNGRAVCSCPPGTSGDRCSETVCTPACENGGVCSAPNGQPICTCAHPFLGANCNIFDVCSDNSTCSQYGGTAKCLIDATSLATKFSKLLVNSSYACLCRNENEEYVDCADLANTERAAVAKAMNATDHSNGTASFSSLTTASLPVPPPIAETISPLRNFNINSSDALVGLSAPQGPPGASVEHSSVGSATEGTVQQSHQASAEGSHQQGPSSETSGGEVVEKPASDATRDPGRVSQEGGTTVGFPTDNLNGGITSASKDDESAGEASKEVEPTFPLTNIPLGNVDAANVTRAEPASVEEEHPAQFTRLPDLPPRKVSEESAGTTASFSTSSSTEEGSTTASTTLTEETNPTVGPEGIEDELGGDNGFERVTQIVDSPSTSGASVDGHVTMPVASGGIDHSAG